MASGSQLDPCWWIVQDELGGRVGICLVDAVGDMAYLSRMLPAIYKSLKRSLELSSDLGPYQTKQNTPQDGLQGFGDSVLDRIVEDSIPCQCSFTSSWT